jgi:hypothetical protein
MPTILLLAYVRTYRICKPSCGPAKVPKYGDIQGCRNRGADSAHPLLLAPPTSFTPSGITDIYLGTLTCQIIV